MARRKKTSPIEDLMDIVAMLPWWAGTVLAVVSYLLLHRVASQQLVVTGQPGQTGAVMAQTMWIALAKIGQYILPVICLAGAGMSAWRRKERKKLVVDVAQSKASDALDGMSWREFEMLVGEGFRLQGYQVVGNRRRWRRWWCRSRADETRQKRRREISRAVQAMACLQGWRGCGA